MAAGKKEETTPTPQAQRVEPPKMEGRGKQATHTPEVIAGIAKSAAEGWTTNGLSYNTKSGAQGACQTVKLAIVAGKYANATSDLTSRIWEDGGKWYFAIAAKSAVR